MNRHQRDKLFSLQCSRCFIILELELNCDSFQVRKSFLMPKRSEARRWDFLPFGPRDAAILTVIGMIVTIVALGVGAWIFMATRHEVSENVNQNESETS